MTKKTYCILCDTELVYLVNGKKICISCDRRKQNYAGQAN